MDDAGSSSSALSCGIDGILAVSSRQSDSGADTLSHPSSESSENYSSNMIYEALESFTLANSRNFREMAAVLPTKEERVGVLAKHLAEGTLPSHISARLSYFYRPQYPHSIPEEERNAALKAHEDIYRQALVQSLQLEHNTWAKDLVRHKQALDALADPHAAREAFLALHPTFLQEDVLHYVRNFFDVMYLEHFHKPSSMPSLSVPTPSPSAEPTPTPTAAAVDPFANLQSMLDSLNQRMDNVEELQKSYSSSTSSGGGRQQRHVLQRWRKKNSRPAEPTSRSKKVIGFAQEVQVLYFSPNLPVTQRQASSTEAVQRSARAVRRKPRSRPRKPRQELLTSSSSTPISLVVSAK